MSDAGVSVLPAVPAWFRFQHGPGAHLGAVDPAAGRFVDLGPLDVMTLLGRGELHSADLAARIARGAVDRRADAVPEAGAAAGQDPLPGQELRRPRA